MMMNTQNNQAANAMDLQIIGAIKIKDGLFIGDQFAAQVSIHFFTLSFGLGPRVHHNEQGDAYY